MQRQATRARLLGVGAAKKKRKAEEQAITAQVERRVGAIHAQMAAHREEGAALPAPTTPAPDQFGQWIAKSKVREWVGARVGWWIGGRVSG